MTTFIEIKILKTYQAAYTLFTLISHEKLLCSKITDSNIVGTVGYETKILT